MEDLEILGRVLAGLYSRDEISLEQKRQLEELSVDELLELPEMHRETIDFLWTLKKEEWSQVSQKMKEIFANDQRVFLRMAEFLEAEFRKCHFETIEDVFENGQGLDLLNQGNSFNNHQTKWRLLLAATWADGSEEDQCRLIDILFEQGVRFGFVEFYQKREFIGHLLKSGKDKLAERICRHPDFKNAMRPERVTQPPAATGKLLEIVSDDDALRALRALLC